MAWLTSSFSYIYQYLFKRNNERISSRLCYSGYLKAKDKDEISLGLHIPANTPPILLAHANDDSEKVGGSNAEHSGFMYIALKRARETVKLIRFRAKSQVFVR